MEISSSERRGSRSGSPRACRHYPQCIVYQSKRTQARHAEIALALNFFFPVRLRFPQATLKHAYKPLNSTWISLLLRPTALAPASRERGIIGQGAWQYVHIEVGHGGCACYGEHCPSSFCDVMPSLREERRISAAHSTNFSPSAVH